MDVVALARQGMAQYGLDGPADASDLDLQNTGLVNTLQAYELLDRKGLAKHFDGSPGLLTLSREQRLRRVENFLHHPTSPQKALEVLTMVFFCRKAVEWRKRNGHHADEFSSEYSRATMRLNGMTGGLLRRPEVSAQLIVDDLQKSGLLNGSRAEALEVVEAAIRRDREGVSFSNISNGT